MTSNLCKLIDSVCDFYQADISNQTHGFETLEQVVSRLRDAQMHVSPLPPRQLVACRWLDVVFRQSADSKTQTVLDALEPVLSEFHWLQNPNYSDKKMAQSGYMENYAYCELAGSGGLVDAGVDIKVGFFLLGPGLHYPEHNHPATETYHVLCGEAQWRRGDEDWVSRSSGSFIFHSPWEVHETRTLEQPLLTLYSWQGEISTAAELI